ncbi:peroxidase family protein [Bradyrhizobium elkanii]|uniref:peroxidase family protein n=1 Tax=Bradyrhizobium elkanii TaxID=29448 RepID=UPI002714855D|nr:peroxidase family protein [Bradyrhizobium elkanii]WLB09526.1 peroxidase family protein [Bradyrhizobium elkanii]WLB72526.1 peroxidase family protein [Bradyrhizobium elkanii]
MPTLLAAVNLGVLRDRLRAHNLFHAGYGLDKSSDWSAGKERWRSPDGSFNSLDHPRMGMTGARFGRNFPLTECVPDSGDALLDPSPRLISRELLARRSFIPATTLNLLAAAWIQFETHNWFSHGVPKEGDEFKIPLQSDDEWPENVDGCMQIRRTLEDCSPRETWLGATPTYRNTNSHWWDAGQIYGSSQDRQTQVRSKTDGKLKVGEDGMLLPDPDRPGADLTGFNDNWWVGLSLLHNLFAREHNVICDGLKVRYPTWSDEELFQRARLINAALIAKIHTVEWTPGILAHPALDFGMHANWSGVPYRVMRAVLGKNNEAAYGIVGSPNDQHSAPYALTEEFTAVYRLHPLVPDEVNVRRLGSSELRRHELVNMQGHGSRDFMQAHGFVNLMYSFGTANPGAIRLYNYPNFLRQFRKDGQPLLDMAAVDIMRDRERGVPRYNRFRELLGKGRVTTFEEITSIPGAADKMREIYKGDVDRVDLLVGLLAEDLPKGFGFSDTAFRIFILMASRRLKSDRFFTDDYRSEIYTDFGLDWIRNNGLKSVLLRHAPQLGPALEGVNNGFAPWNVV